MKKIFTVLMMTTLSMMFVLILSSSSCNKTPVNQNPVISSVSVTPASVAANGVVTVAVTASDPDGDNLTYAYNATGGAVQGTGANASWTAPGQAGSYSVTVTVTDGKGGTVSSNGSLTVSAPVTQITGSASFPAGTSGDLSNAKVSIYTSYDNWANNSPIKFGTASGSGANVSFTLTDINPGNYYLDVWKDNDNSGTWTTGDYVGWYGSGGLGSPALTEIQLTNGQTFNCTVQMYIGKKGGK